MSLLPFLTLRISIDSNFTGGTKMFGFLKKKEKYEPLNLNDRQISSLGNGKLIPVTSVSDEMFAEEMMGETIAFSFTGNGVTIFAPANGSLSAIFPTGHAFGITTADGVEILVHIGVNTVESKGAGFKLLGKKQGDRVKAGDPIVTVDFDKLGSSYDMSTMLIITDPDGKTVTLKKEGTVERSSIIGTIA